MAEAHETSPPEAAAPKPKRTERNTDIVAAVVLAIFTIIVCVWQIARTPAHPTTTETALFNLLQFILTVGFTWFSTRAASRSEFEQSLKKFAISAYRRIDDIERMIERLRREIGEMISAVPKAETSNLRVIEAIVLDTSQVARSSISDWADVIGDELLALERIKRLEHEKALLQQEAISEEREPAKADDSAVLRAELSEALKKIEAEIAKTQSLLPPRLQLTTDQQDETRPPRLATVIERMKAAALSPGGQILDVITGPDYKIQRDPTTLKVGERLRVAPYLGRGQGLNLVDQEGALAGRLTSTRWGRYPEFAEAISICYGTTEIEVEFRKLNGARKSEAKSYPNFEVKILTPLIDRQATAAK